MKRVLLVSTSKVFLARNTNLLVGRGFFVFTAPDGTEALRLHREHCFDLVLSELQLDDMDGGTLCSELRKIPGAQHLPVILICHGTGSNIQKVESSSASAMLLKPVTPALLLETIGSFLDMQVARSRRVALAVTVTGITQTFEFLCISRDISTTGILLETENSLSLGARIVCKFKLWDTIDIEATGEVARCLSDSDAKNFYGVKFVEISAQHRKAIDDYVKQHGA